MKKITILFRSAIIYRGCFILLLLSQALWAFSQDESSFIKQQFQKYSESHYREKIFLHTDKTVYATGEVMWFKAYVVDANSNKPSSLSKIGYVEIISADKKPLLQAKIDIDSGRGSGSFQIPSSLRTGNYLVRSYTNWMKNFDAQFYFQEEITIINPNKKLELNTADSASENYIGFFPEGGNLVYDLDNTVAFKITDAHVKGLDASGVVVNQKKDTVAIFATDRFGMGTFSFHPTKGNMYHAIFKLDDKKLTRELPFIYDKGWAMHVTDKGSYLAVRITCNYESERNVVLFAQTKHSVKFAAVKPLHNDSASFTINKSDLGKGISQLTVFNAERQPVCERLYFKKPTSILHLVSDNVRQEYQARKKVDISITAKDADGLPTNADLSVSVYLTDSLQPEQKINLLNYLWLASGIKGYIESPGYYFENSGAEVSKSTDNLMLTQGWRRFKWEDILNHSKPSFTFLPEYEGHIITGKIVPKIAGLRDSAVAVYLSVPGKNFRFSNSYSTSSGVIRFNVEKFYGSREIIAQTNLSDSNYRLFIDKPFSDQYVEGGVSHLRITPNLSNQIALRSIGAQALNIYQPEKEDNFMLPVSYDTTAFYGKPYKQYYLDAYTRFPTMEEVIREYVKEVHLKKKDKKFHFEVFNQPDISYFDNDPLILVDGVPVFDATKIIDMDPLKFQKIDIVATKFFKGNRQYDGIVSLSTYNGDLDSYQLDPNSLVVEYDGLQLEREFYSPQYQTDQELQSRKPDYRNVLYWSPNLKTNEGKKAVTFYTSDIPGKYMIIIQGISNSGLVGVTSQSFNVAAPLGN